MLLEIKQGFAGLLTFLPASFSVTLLSTKPISLYYQLSVLQACYQLEDGRICCGQEGIVAQLLFHVTDLSILDTGIIPSKF